MAAFAQRYTIALRRPDVAQSLVYAPSADFATDLVCDATLRDATVPVRLGGLKANERIAWLDAVTHLDEQLAAAADLSLDALEERPGWPYHAALLGQLVYTRAARSLSPAIVTEAKRWIVPMRIATAATPYDSVLWQFTALAYLQTWPDLGPRYSDADAVFRRAFDDRDFVHYVFGSANTILGADAAIAHLPDSPRPLREAFDQLAKAGAIDEAWRVYQRWDAAEWRRRASDLADIENAADRRDVEALRSACEAWTRNHSVWDYDTAAAHGQAARLLQLWPASDSGQWFSDSRADIIRYFISGRREGVTGSILAHAADPVAGVPPPTQAQLRVLAGDLPTAELIARRSESFGSFEWKPYIYELSRYWLRNANRDKARSVLGDLPVAARAECEAFEIIGDDPPRQASLAVVFKERTDIGICQLPRASARVTLTPANNRSAIVEYGWDGARIGSVFVPARESVDVYLPAASGQRTVTIRAPSQPDVAISVVIAAAS